MNMDVDSSSDEDDHIELDENNAEASVDSINEDTDEDDDEVVKAIKAEKNKQRDRPPNIDTEDFVVAISFHPSRNLIALATIMGDVLMYEYTNDENKLLNTHELHLKACRCVEFNSEGTIMYTAAKVIVIIILKNNRDI